MMNRTLDQTSTQAAERPGLASQGGFATAFLATTWGRAAAVLLGSLFVALCAQVAVPLPWTPVPMTMQPFGVLVVGLLLGPALGAAAMAAYLLEGVAGLPVFVPGFGGLLPLAASAGYLLSYPVVAAVTGFLYGRRGGFLRALGAAAAGSALILVSGASWLAMMTHASAAAAFRLGVLPFAGGDALKVVLAAMVAAGLARTKRFDRTDGRLPA